MLFSMTEEEFIFNELINKAFPDLTKDNFRLTSPDTRTYNCIAWAAEDTEMCWWPDPNDKDSYWPNNIPREETIASFIEVFESLGYTECDSPEYEVGFIKIAIFAKDRCPTHAARQLPSGKWTSKLGDFHDIEHALEAICGPEYGKVSVIMKKELPQSVSQTYAESYY